MLDLHSHVLPGVDDGPETMAESLDLLRAAQDEGITRLAATPHVRDDYPTAPGDMERLTRELNDAARAERLAVEVLPGGELDISFARSLDNDTLHRFGLGGNPRLLLVEFPYHGWPLALLDTVELLAGRGFRIVLAHPERSYEVQERPDRLLPLVETGVLVQLTAASVDGRLGRRSQRCARALLEAGSAHLLASDAHAPAVRAVGMTAAAEALDDPELARWLTHDVPAALVDDAPLPARPAPRRARGISARWRA